MLNHFSLELINNSNLSVFRGLGLEIFTAHEIARSTFDYAATINIQGNMWVSFILRAHKYKNSNTLWK